MSKRKSPRLTPEEEEEQNEQKKQLERKQEQALARQRDKLNPNKRLVRGMAQALSKRPRLEDLMNMTDESRHFLDPLYSRAEEHDTFFSEAKTTSPRPYINLPAEEVKQSRLRKMQSLQLSDNLGRYRMKVLWSSRGDEPEMGDMKTFNSIG